MMPKRKFAGSRVQKRSVSFGRGRKSSLSLEEEFWACLRKIAGDQGLSLGWLIATIDEQRHYANLSSAVRLFVLDHYRRLAEAKVH